MSDRTHQPPGEDTPTVEAFLAELVADTVGAHATPRPGQTRLAADMAAHPRVTGEAPTGVGKSFAALANAAVNARHGLRTLISTESLSLQSQIMSKDAPAAQATDARLRGDGTSFSIAVLKGWSNYVCLARTVATARQVCGVAYPGPADPADIPRLRERLAMVRGTVTVDGAPTTAGEIVPLLDWALGTDTGDRADCPVPTAAIRWRHVSVSTDECARAMCPLVDLCHPARVREQVADADVVVTNHSMLAVQAARGIPTVIGSPKVGAFHQVIVDEAHTLPDAVRAQGQEEVSAWRIAALRRSARRLLTPGTGGAVDRWFTDGDLLETRVDRLAQQWVEQTRDTDGRLSDTDLPLAGLGEALSGWAAALDGIVTPLAKIAHAAGDLHGVQAAGHIHAAVDRFRSAVAALDEPRPGVARWVETVRSHGRETPTFQSSRVAVATAMKEHLWEFTGGSDTAPIQPPERVDLISGTLPAWIGAACGVEATRVEYPSPFDTAYEHSLLYVPKITPDQAHLVAERGRGGRWRFSTERHRQFAAGQIVRLVGACTGGAIILAANSTSGRAYADRLRTAYPDRTILDQWSGVGVQELITRWRDEQDSVLVGVRSMMTGVDGPGRTCELVIIDRPPRAQRNPVDEARVQLAYNRTGDRWGADRQVYVADAALLLEQALGRLIRSTGDVGVAAILDCRLTRTSAVTYPATTRGMYLHAARRFVHKTTNLNRALTALRLLDEEDHATA